jgi:hypothetical protein
MILKKKNLIHIKKKNIFFQILKLKKKNRIFLYFF